MLAAIASDLLVIPASSAPVERDISSGRRNKLSDKNLEREVLVKKNKAIVAFILFIVGFVRKRMLRV